MQQNNPTDKSHTGWKPRNLIWRLKLQLTQWYANKTYASSVEKCLWQRVPELNSSAIERPIGELIPKMESFIIVEHSRREFFEGGGPFTIILSRWKSIWSNKFLKPIKTGDDIKSLCCAADPKDITRIVKQRSEANQMNRCFL